MSTDEIKEILTSLGYQLSDRGAYWQTNAVFRQGDNKTAIQIYKDTGVWKDYVSNTPPLRFERLVEKTLGPDDHKVKELLKSKNLSSLLENPLPPTEKLKMETIYSEDSLKKLLPHYRFYNDRNICSDVLKGLKGGLATQGQLYQRFVFPIYNEDSQIHGFSGRDMLNKEGRPKWKHVGRKSHWVYPAFVPQEGDSLMNFLEGADNLILVESIGDLLSLHQHGYKNVLVTFGLDVSPALISSLVHFQPKKIVLSFNNDSLSKENRGLDSCVKNYLKLMSYFDPDKISICLPLENDFGDMKSDSFEKWTYKLDNIDVIKQQRLIVKESMRLIREGKLSKKLIKNRNLLNNIVND